MELRRLFLAEEGGCDRRLDKIVEFGVIKQRRMGWWGM
jgi:hypothetical protein